MNKLINNKIFKFIFRMILTSFIFFLICIPFKELFALVPGMTEVRPANVIPPVFGIMFGLPAAIGITIGNFISDLLANTSLSVALQGAVTNFLYSYIPYVMWYKMKSKDDKVNIPSLNSVMDIIRYILIIFIDSLAITTLLTLIFEHAGFGAISSTGLLLLFNNFDFAMIIGVPMLSIIGNSKLEFAVPKKREISSSSRKIWNIISLTPFLVSAIGVVLFIYSSVSGGNEQPGITKPALFIMIILLLIYCFRPMCNDVVDEREKEFDLSSSTSAKKRMSIRSKVTLGFLMIAVVFISFAFISTYMAISKSGLSRLEKWTYVYYTIGAATNIIFAVTIIFLMYVERSISNPVEVLSVLVSKFAKQDHTGSKDNQDISNQCKDIKTGDEIEVLADSFGHMMQDIDDYVVNLANVTAEKERIGAELNIATQIQADMLPNIFPAFPCRKEFDIYATMDPAKEVGGDFYDFFMPDDKHLCIVIADVSGKGVPAALFMVISKTLLKNRTLMGGSPSEILEDVNNQLCENNKAELFVTVWLAIIDLTTGKGAATNAGHEYPVLKRKDGEFELIKNRHSPAVGILDEMIFGQVEFELFPGDRVFVYTDGVPEATNSNDELFGTDRMVESLNRNKDKSLKEILVNMKKDVDDFVGDAPQFDDVTMLGFDYFGVEES